MEKLDWEKIIEEILGRIQVSEDYFKRKGATSEIHNRVVEAIRNEWTKRRRPSIEERAFKIDFVGRTFDRYGKVELAVEVDTWWKRYGSWVKLLDINAEKKIWIYICKDMEKSEDYFVRALSSFRELAELRKEDITNNVTIFMKVAGKEGVKKAHLWEKEGEAKAL